MYHRDELLGTLRRVQRHPLHCHHDIIEGADLLTDDTLNRCDTLQYERLDR
jgi:hypothetical protein